MRILFFSAYSKYTGIQSEYYTIYGVYVNLHNHHNTVPLKSNFQDFERVNIENS
jgi:hypothetical protein